MMAQRSRRIEKLARTATSGGLIHGGSSSTNPGERRITIYRYGPIWGASRFGYRYAPEFLETITPAQRRILQPVPPICRSAVGVSESLAGKES